jgi:NAD(P)-dependent dehydrogenase (short-subunit alcohol dehydrogenase family)
MTDLYDHRGHVALATGGNGGIGIGMAGAFAVTPSGNLLELFDTAAS